MRFSYLTSSVLVLLVLGCSTQAFYDEHKHASHSPSAAPAAVVASNSQITVHDRQTIQTTKDEYAHVIGDMQKMLASIQGITGALATQDWATVHQLSTALRPENTMASTDTASVSFHKKIPAGWRAMGGPMHQGFTALANEAAGGKRTDIALKLLSGTMTQCVACHSTFALKVSP